MEISEIIAPQGVVFPLCASSKKQALQQLAKKASDLTGIDEREIRRILLEREKLGTTGIGGGIAIPHGKLPNLDRLYGLFARLERPIDFASVDSAPVDMICLLLAPEKEGANHLRALALVSRLLRNGETCGKLRSTDSEDGIYAILTNNISSSKAVQNPKGGAAPYDHRDLGA